MAVRHEAMARQEKALTDKEAALAEAERAAADMAAELGLQEKRLQSSQRSHARSTAPKQPTFTNATPGTHAHQQWKRSQVDKIEQDLTTLFGSAWSQEFGGDKDKNTQAANGRHTKPDDVVEVLDAFFKRYQTLFDLVGDPRRRGKNLVAAAEQATVEAIQTHFDNVAVALHTATEITDRGYQALINYTSFVWNDDCLERFILPWGNKMARWMPKNDLKLKLNAISKELGIDISPNAAFLDPELVLIKRLVELVEKGLLSPTPCMEIKVQVLGDARPSGGPCMGVNGTTVVMKALYNDKNVNGDKPRTNEMESIVSKIKEQLAFTLETRQSCRAERACP